MRVAYLLAVCSLVACSNPIDERANQQAQKNAQAVGETTSPPDAPTKYKVLADDVNKQANTVDYPRARRGAAQAR